MDLGGDGKGQIMANVMVLYASKQTKHAVSAFEFDTSTRQKMLCPDNHLGTMFLEPFHFEVSDY
jgi:hypothetical protein